jgi:integrase
VRVRYRDEHGKPRWSRTFHSVDEARGWQADQKRALTPEALERRAVPFRDLAERWIAGAKAGEIGQRRGGKPYAHRSLIAYRADLDRYVLPTMGDRDARKLTAVDWQIWLDALRRQGLSRNTIDRILNSVRNVYGWACSPSRYLLTLNATRGLELPPKDEKRRDRVVPHEEAQRMLAAMAESDRLVYALAFYTGLRIGEIFALDWSDVDLTGGSLRVRESKTEAGKRRVPILEPLLPPLKAALLAQGRPDGGYVVRGVRRPSELRERVRRALEAAGFVAVTPHECRHTFASYCIASGMNAKAITTLMGHTSVDVTFDRYGHLFPGHEAEAADRLNAYLRGATSAS